jgi:putative hydrolase of HD superfamily
MREIIDFILEVDKLKGVTRATRPLGEAGRDRFENSAEHSWQITLFARALAPHAGPGVDIDRVVRMLLVHDIGEIDTGDTIVYAQTNHAEKSAAERAAVDRIFGLLPASQRDEFLALWQEFEDAATPESRFAHAADRAMPALLNLANQGQSWRDHGITYERVIARIGPPIEAGCPSLWHYMKARLDEAKEQGWFGIGS